MNELRAYLNALAPPEQEQFAARCGTSVGYLRKALSTGQVLREGLCIRIERESGGVVRLEAIRPDVDWAYLGARAAGAAECLRPNQHLELTQKAPAAINSDAQGVAHA